MLKQLFQRRSASIRSGNHLETVTDGLARKAQRSGLEDEIARTALKQVMRRYAIPATWLSTDGVKSQFKGQTEHRCVHIVIKQWNEKILHYAPVLQKKILQSMDLFDPKTDHQKYVFSWGFSENIGYPISELPNIVVWSNPDVQSFMGIPFGDSKSKAQIARADLEAMFHEPYGRAFADTDVFAQTRPMSD